MLRREHGTETAVQLVVIHNSSCTVSVIAHFIKRAMDLLLVSLDFSFPVQLTLAPLR